MQHLIPKEACNFLQAHPAAVFIDARSEMEYMFVAHVRKAASVNRPVVLICRSGRRSADAGSALKNAGLKDIYNVTHGFEGDLDDTHHRNSRNGWRFDGLSGAQT